MTRAAASNSLRGSALLGGFILIAACTTNLTGPDSSDTADRADSYEQVEQKTSRATDRDQAIDAYRDYLARYPDSPEYQRVSRRLADLLVEQASDIQLAGADLPHDSPTPEEEAAQALDEAISYYESLIDSDPGEEEYVDLLYQLSRAYEGAGKSKLALDAIDRLLQAQPDANRRLYADTRFRQGELFFSQRRYFEAGLSYQAVVDLGKAVPAYEPSLYKLGWSLFKQERYREALPVMLEFLELRTAVDGSNDERQSPASPSGQEQVEETFQVISRCFVHLGGPESVDRYLSENGKRSYGTQIYLELADWYAEQGQVTEAVSTWNLLAGKNPFAAEAPQLIARGIELYKQAGFQQRAIEMEELYVNSYGMGRDFWTVHSPGDFPMARIILRDSLRDLSLYYHRQALEKGDEVAFVNAERWYREYLDTFGEDADAAAMNFELAELLYQRGHYSRALDEYERTAWSYGEHALAINAAVNALHASREAAKHASTGDTAVLEKRERACATRLVLTYPEDPASPGVLAQLGNALLQHEAFDEALELSRRVLVEAGAGSAGLRQTAWTMRAQALYALEEYPEAADAYREALQLAEEDDQRGSALQEGLAMSLHHQAAQARDRGDTAAAFRLYRQTADTSQDLQLRSRAEYDMGSLLLAEQSWGESIRLFRKFRSDYPLDPMQSEVTRKLAFALEQAGYRDQAAAEYLRLGSDSVADAAVRREALVRATDLFTQTGNIEQAIATGETYIELFPAPSSHALPVMQRLADLEINRGDPLAAKHWLEQIIGLDKRSGNSTTHVAAAEATLELAKMRVADFRDIQLVEPVQDNLASKLEAMEQALAALESASGYGVSTIVVEANFYIASLYDELGQALQESERPSDLTAEELAEYDAMILEQARHFEQQATEIYRTNASRSGVPPGNEWPEKSVQRLDELRHDY